MYSTPIHQMPCLHLSAPVCVSRLNQSHIVVQVAAIGAVEVNDPGRVGRRGVKVHDQRRQQIFRGFTASQTASVCVRPHCRRDENRTRCYARHQHP